MMDWHRISAFDHEGVLLISDKINGTVGFHEALLR